MSGCEFINLSVSVSGCSVRLCALLPCALLLNVDDLALFPSRQLLTMASALCCKLSAVLSSSTTICPVYTCRVMTLCWACCSARINQ